MSIKESALAAITSITSSDFIRAVTSAGASRRITLANLANFILRSYAPSTSSPTSGSVQAQINSLNSKLPKAVTIGSETTFTIPEGYRGTLKIIDSTPGRCGMYFVVSSGVGAVAKEDIKAATEVTITGGANTLTINPTSGTRRVVFETYSGTGEPS